MVLVMGRKGKAAEAVSTEWSHVNIAEAALYLGLSPSCAL